MFNCFQLSIVSKHQVKTYKVKIVGSHLLLWRLVWTGCEKNHKISKFWILPLGKLWSSWNFEFWIYLLLVLQSWQFPESFRLTSTDASNMPKPWSSFFMGWKCCTKSKTSKWAQGQSWCWQSYDISCMFFSPSTYFWMFLFLKENYLYCITIIYIIVLYSLKSKKKTKNTKNMFRSFSLQRLQNQIVIHHSSILVLSY